MRLSMVLTFFLLAPGCIKFGENHRSSTSRLADFVVGEFVTPTGARDWQQMEVNLQRQDGDKGVVAKKIDHTAFVNHQASDLTLSVPFGTYLIALVYRDSAGATLYQVCADQRGKQYIIDKPTFAVTIPICAESSGPTASPSGQVSVNPVSSVTIKPVTGDQSPATATATATATVPPASNPGATLPPPPGSGADAATCTDGQGGFDVVAGQCIDRQKSFSVQGGDIYAYGQKIRLAGINWFGLETTKLSLHGLWSGRSINSFVDQIAALGFNALRIPVSPEALNPATAGDDGFAHPIDELNALIKYAQSKGIYILLDLHTCTKNLPNTGNPGPGTGNCAFYSDDAWAADLQAMAALAASYSNVVGIDLFNEPFGMVWDDWQGKINRIADKVLAKSPRTLLFVQGVAGASAFGAYGPFWGENLFEAGTKTLKIPASRLVYAPHTYGPGTYDGHDYFKAANFPQNMPTVWDSHFGYLHAAGQAMAIGEFGGKYTDKDKIWQDAFVGYLIDRHIDNFFYWSLNPDSGDTGGLLQDDWQTVNPDKLSLLTRLIKR